LYKKTNENLEAIVKGLNIKPNDYILAVGGSGDQPFALIEYAEKVLAVDINGYQIRRMHRQNESLKIDDYESFWKRRGSKDYFNQEKLEAIRKKLSGLEIRKADILNVCQNENGFNKIYLSNALNGHRDELGPCLSIVSRSIPLGGLVYASNGTIIKRAISETGLFIDEHLNILLFLIEDRKWDPLVLRKLSEPKIVSPKVKYEKLW
jgi:hypothetical protein